MPLKRYTTEQIVGKLREAEVILAKGWLNYRVSVVCITATNGAKPRESDKI